MKKQKADLLVAGLNDRSQVSVNRPRGSTDSGRGRVAVISGSYFPTPGVNVAASTFTAGDGRVPGGHPAAAVSHDCCNL